MAGCAMGHGKQQVKTPLVPMQVVCSATWTCRVSAPVASIAAALLHTLQGRVAAVVVVTDAT